MVSELTPIEPNKIQSKPTSSSRWRKGQRVATARSQESALQAFTASSLFLNVLPRTLRRTLRYAETFTFTTGAAGVCGTEQVMLLNSIFDPNFTGVGHRPYGTSQLALFYGKYLVHSFRVKLIAATIGSAAEVAICYKFDNNVGGSALAGQTIDAATEAPMIGTAILSASGITRTRQVVLSGTCAQVLGVTPAQYANEVTTYGAAMTANPTTTAILRIALASYSAAAAEACSIQVVIDFDTELFNPVQMAQS